MAILLWGSEPQTIILLDPAVNKILLTAIGTAGLVAGAFLILFRRMARSSEAVTELARLASRGGSCRLIEFPRPKRPPATRREERSQFRERLAAVRQEARIAVAGVKMLLLMAPDDRPDLVRSLFQHEVLLRQALLRAQFALALHSLGLRRTLDPAPLDRSLQSMHRSAFVLLEYVKTAGFRLESAQFPPAT